MAKKTLIIEVEEKVIKVVVSKKKRNKADIVNSFMFDIPDHSVMDGQIIDPESLAQIISTQLLKNNLKKIKNVVFVLNSTKVVNKEIELPAVKEKRIGTIIETNANDYFPVDMSNYHISYTILEKSKLSYRVLVLAAPRTIINDYIRVGNALHMNIKAIDFGGNSQYQLFKNNKEEQVVAYLNCNLTNTFVNFIENGSLVLQRSFPVGGDSIINTFMRTQSRDDSQYIASLEDMESQELINSLFPEEQRKRIAERFMNGIMRIMDFFKLNYSDKNISQIVLLGTYSNIAGLKELIEETTGIPTVLLQHTDVEDILAKEIQHLNYYVSCIGATVNPVDFLPEEYKNRNKKNTSPTKSGKIVLITSILLCVLLFGYQCYMYYTTNDELNNLNAKLDSMAGVQEIYDTYKQYEQISNNFKVLDDLKHTPNTELVAFFEELETKMPSENSVYSAVCSDTDVTMKVTVPDLAQAAKVVSQLRSFETIQDITVSGFSESKDSTGNTSVTFSVSCTYNLEKFKPVENVEP